MIFHYFCPDKSSFKIAVNNSRSLRCGHSNLNCPCPYFLWAHSKERLKVEQLISSPYHFINSWFIKSCILKKCQPVLPALKLSNFGFYSPCNNNNFGIFAFKCFPDR